MFARFDVIGSVTDRGHGRNGGLVQDVVHPVDGAARHRRVGEVALEELDLRQVGEVRPLAGDEAVHDAHAFAAAHQLLGRDGIR